MVNCRSSQPIVDS
uniref:Uncharacterized protein n=1 Tax=Arundo donax TaxID=35708 RepID=A0A0A9BRS2_ARUDO